MAIHIFLTFLVLISSNLQAREISLPPVGKREYIIDDKSPASTTTIRPMGLSIGSRQNAIMRDPIPLGKGNRFEKLHSQGMVQRAMVPKVARVVFQPVHVKGRYAVPRVLFDRTQIPIERKDENFQADYKSKIRESENYLGDFEW